MAHPLLPPPILAFLVPPMFQWPTCILIVYEHIIAMLQGRMRANAVPVVEMSPECMEKDVVVVKLSKIALERFCKQRNKRLNVCLLIAV